MSKINFPIIEFSKIPPDQRIQAYNETSARMRETNKLAAEGKLKVIHPLPNLSDDKKAMTPCLSDRTKPGGMIKHILTNLGIGEYKGCGCAAMCFKMNQWGWLGCLRKNNRKELVQWFSERAKEQKIQVTPKLIVKALIASIRANRVNDNVVESP